MGLINVGRKARSFLATLYSFSMTCGAKLWFNFRYKLNEIITKLFVEYGTSPVNKKVIS